MLEFLIPDWGNILQIAITAPLLYALVITGIRVVGNRSTSAMNNFDWIVTVAIGGIFATTVVRVDVHVLEGGFGIIFLLAIQYCITLGVRKSETFRNLLKATPQLLVYDGEFLEDNMRSQRIVRAEVYGAMRQRGYQNVNEIFAVVLENNARLSVIGHSENDATQPFSLSDVDGLPEGLQKDLKKKGANTDEEAFHTD